RRTDSVVLVLMMYTVNIGLITCICTTLCFILYATMPRSYIFLAVHFNLSKMYLNSLLATLNAQAPLRER
ncbi:hypothetical protein PILCRDRAFT_29657, partial [Piloderma croceum F 1598]